MEAFLIYIFFLLVLSAFFSGSETGLTVASRSKIHRLKLEGNKRAEKVSHLRKDKDRLISAILLGNNAVNIAASAMATSVAVSTYGEKGVLYVTIVMTFVILIFAEIIPKTYAFRNAERVALGVAPIFVIIVKVLSPITITVQAIANNAMALLGVGRTMDRKKSELAGTEVLRGAIELHHDEGAVVKDDRDMLGSILDLAEMEVSEIMVHRKEMQTIDANLPVVKIAEKSLSSRHNRLPLWKNNPDNIIGILHNKDLVWAIQEHAGPLDNLDLKAILKEPWFIPEATTLKDQLRAFREKHNRLALIVDEYGALLGLVTLEDILEEIVGQIDNEYDARTQDIKKQADGSYIVDGRVTLRDLNRELDWDLSDDEATTVAGLIIHEAQLIPDIAQVFHFYNYRFEILKKQRNQITSVRIQKMQDDQ